MTDSSSASTASTPPQLSRLTTYSWISRQLASSRAWLSICSAQSRSVTWRGSAPSSTSKESAREWAGSVDMTRVRCPRAAALAAVAAATVVLPTPPLPVNRRMRTVLAAYMDSTRRFRSPRAERTICLAACRIRKPGIGIPSETSSW
jgi:hypothetical protein